MDDQRDTRQTARRASTVAQLRRDIDSGRTGDKVAAPDFAAAPLGTDEEAAGTPVSPEAVALSRAQEVRERPRGSSPSGNRLWLLLAVFAFIIAATAAVVAVALRS